MKKVILGSLIALMLGIGMINAQLASETSAVGTFKPQPMLALKAVGTAGKITSIFLKMKNDGVFDKLISEVNAVATKKKKYSESQIPVLMDNISTVLEQLVGNKESFFVLLLRAIGKEKAVKLAERLEVMGVSMVNLFNNVKNVGTLVDLIANEPKEPVAPPTEPEKLEEIPADVELDI